MSASGDPGKKKMDTFDLPLFELLHTVDPDIKRMFEEYLNYTIFDERPLALDLKTRYLVLVGITTAVRGDREGIEWSSQLAMKHGATEREVLEAISLTNLPAGTPAMEYAADVWRQMREGQARVQRSGAELPERGFRAWSSWRRPPDRPDRPDQPDRPDLPDRAAAADAPRGRSTGTGRPGGNRSTGGRPGGNRSGATGTTPRPSWRR